MLGTDRLLASNIKYNKSHSKLLDSKIWHYQVNSGNIIDFKALSNISGFLYNASKPYIFKLPIILDLSCKGFSDKLSYVLLECMCQNLLENGYRIAVKLPRIPNIYTDGSFHSPLRHLNSLQQSTILEFKKDFNFSISQNHFRRLLPQSQVSDTSRVSKIMQDIATFLYNSFIPSEYSDKISDVLSELVDNAIEHSQSDCLIDIDIAPNYTKDTDTKGEYYGINIAIVNFSDILLGQKIAQLLEQKSQRYGYDKLAIAMSNHKRYWGKYYKKEDFFIMAAFQHKISSRDGVVSTGGTGLTKLISSLEQRSDGYKCYVVSGDRILRFQHEYLDFDSNHWVGFNKEKDFINKPPDSSNIAQSAIYIPGTAFNLNFAVKKETL